MPLFQLLLRGFEFPAALPPKNANFRFVVQLRHFDATSETWVTTESVSPGLTAYWECDPSKAHDVNRDAKYIRDGDTPRFRVVSPWDQVLLLVSSGRLFQLRVVVYDVNRKDWIDTLRSLGEHLVGVLVGAASGLPIPSQFATPVGTLLEKLRGAVLDALAKKDTVLFALIYEFGVDQGSQLIDLAHGGYLMRLELLTFGEPPAAGPGTVTHGGYAGTQGRVDVTTAFAYVPPR